MLPDPTASTYSYSDVADRLEQVLGKRPERSTLRAGVTSPQESPVGPGRNRNDRPRITAGMPSPLPATSRTAPARFDAQSIERWLAEHPRLRWANATQAARTALASGNQDVEDVVAAARSAGLSWREITVVLSEHDGHEHSVAGVHKRFRHLRLPPASAGALDNTE